MTRLVSLVELYLNDAFLETLPNSFGRLVSHSFVLDKRLQNMFLAKHVNHYSTN